MGTIKREIMNLFLAEHPIMYNNLRKMKRA